MNDSRVRVRISVVPGFPSFSSFRGSLTVRVERDLAHRISRVERDLAHRISRVERDLAHRISSYCPRMVLVNSRALEQRCYKRRLEPSHGV